METVKFNLELSPEAFEALERLQALLGSPTMEDTLERVFRLYGIIREGNVMRIDRSIPGGGISPEAKYGICIIHSIPLIESDGGDRPPYCPQCGPR